MSEFRRNPITGQWVIIAANRGSRPQEIVVEHVASSQRECPFCEGNESVTPGEVLALRETGSAADGPGWRVRVVPNKYPALVGAVPARPHSRIRPPHLLICGTPTSRPATGCTKSSSNRHRILTSVVDLTDAQFAEVLEVYRMRINATARWVSPSRAVQKRRSQRWSDADAPAQPTDCPRPRPIDFRRSHAVNFACTLKRKALVWRAKSSVVCLPSPICWWHGRKTSWRSARLLPGCPTRPGSFREGIDCTLGKPSRRSCRNWPTLFRGVLVKLERIVKLPAYNYIIHTAPFDIAATDHYHWHIEILPRIANLAGFELGTGCFINTVPPLQAAAALREA